MTELGHADRRRAAVMADVAKLAGVSHQTVSRVINGSDHVRDETRDRVVAAMRMLDYRPNSVARALATGRSKTVGVVTFDTTLYGPASTLFGLERAAHESGLLRLDRQPARARPRRGARRSRAPPQPGRGGDPRDRPSDAGRVLDAAAPGGRASRRRRGRTGRGRPARRRRPVRGRALATHHLLELGHQSVAHIAGPADWVEAQQRVAGWRSALQEAGAPAPAPLMGDWSAQAGYELGRDLAADPDVTAVFCGNDAMALGLLRFLHEEGRTIPGDMSVVGFDDVPEAAFFTPPLTTVRQDFLQVGRGGFDLLIEEIRARGPLRGPHLRPPGARRASEHRRAARLGIDPRRVLTLTSAG